jgi:transcription antitermination factor NusG
MQPDDNCTTSTSERADGWYALYTRHQHEKVIANMLSNKGFEVFLPLYVAGRQWKDRTKHLLVALFPTYVFLRGGLDRRLDVLKTPGVHGFVGWCGKPAEIPEPEMDAVRRAVEGPLRIEPHPFLQCGDLVRIKSGAMMGLEGILVRKKNLFRLVLSVEMLGQSVAMEVDVNTVERVPRAGSAFLAATSGLPENAPSRAITTSSALT